MLMQYIRKIARRIAGPLPAEEVKWVVNNHGELGVRVGDASYYLYKGESIVYDEPQEDGTAMMERPVEKREFGETCRAAEWDDVYAYHDWVDGRDWQPLTQGRDSTARERAEYFEKYIAA